jgi:hypothetical protein
MRANFPTSGRRWRGRGAVTATPLGCLTTVALCIALNGQSTNSCANGSITAANDAASRGKASGARPRAIHSHVLGL